MRRPHLIRLHYRALHALLLDRGQLPQLLSHGEGLHYLLDEVEAIRMPLVLPVLIIEDLDSLGGQDFILCGQNPFEVDVPHLD